MLLLWPALFAYFDHEADRSIDKARVKRVVSIMRKVETKLYCHFVAFALRPLNVFNAAFQTSASKIGTLQKDVQNLLHGFLSNFIQPELLAATPNDRIHSFDFNNNANQLSDEELGFGSATRLFLIENSDELEGTQEEQNFFCFVRKFYSECVRKMIAKFPITDLTISDLSILNPRHRFHVTATSLTRLLKRFSKNFTCDDVDAVLMEFCEYNHCQIVSCQHAMSPLSFSGHHGGNSTTCRRGYC